VMKAIRIASLVVLTCMLMVAGAFAQHFNPVPSTGIPYTIVVEDATWDYGPSLQAGDEIAAYDGALCVGSVVIDAFPVILTAWEEYPDLNLQGFETGNLITYKLWDQSQNSEQPALAHYAAGDATFGSGFGSSVTVNSSDFPVLLAIWSNTSEVPAAGANFQFGAHLYSTVGVTRTGLRFWTTITRPNGSETGVQFQYNFNLAAFMHIARSTLPQNVPGNWDPGVYTVNGKLGVYPVASITDSYTFTKLP
jgi:hypothetical protein